MMDNLPNETGSLQEGQESNLGKYVKVQGGFSFKSSDFSDSGVPVIKIKNVRPRYIDVEEVDCVSVAIAQSARDYFLRDGDVVISMTGSGPNAPNSIVGRVARYMGEPGRYLINQRVGRLIVKDTSKVDKRFLFFLLSQKEIQDRLVSNSTGSANQANISNTQIESLRFIFPPILEQSAIASILGALDDKIEINQRMNNTLESIARALFKSWFVDFEPVRAKVEGYKPEGLDDTIASLFPPRFTETEFGIIPEGWIVETLEKVSFLNPESWSRNNIPDQIEYVDLANTKWGIIESTQSISWEDAPSRAQRILRKGDTIVGTVRPGNGSYSFISSDGLTGSTGFAVLRPREDFYKEFIYLSTTFTDNIVRLTNLADGAAYPAVRPDVVYATPILFPGNEILRQFSQCLSPLMEKIALSNKENRTLGDLRDYLLPRLISGKLRVSDLPKETTTS